MKILISNSSNEPIYKQICRQIKARILSAHINEGDELPSIRKLAKELRVSVITTKRAYDELEREGLIDSVIGKGSFVAKENSKLLREKRLKTVEELMDDAVNEAHRLGLTFEELQEMLSILYTNSKG